MYNKSKKSKRKNLIKKGGFRKSSKNVKNSINKSGKKSACKKKVTWGNREKNGKYNFNNEKKLNLKSNKLSNGWCSLDIEKNT